MQGHGPGPAVDGRADHARADAAIEAGPCRMRPMRLHAWHLFRLLATVALAAAAPGAVVAGLAEGRVAHGPFEIEAGVRRVSTGTFPNQGGNPFRSREVSEFQLRWKGQLVAVGSQTRFWHVLRLSGAPRPALLLVTTGFVLVSEDPSGRLQLQPVRAESASLAELQWLDERNGQPGPSRSFGLEAVRDLQAGTQLQGGRWLRLGSRSILDVATLAVHAVDPWVPIVPGQPITSLSREGDVARAFSPGRTHYVLAAAGPDYGRPGQPHAYGLLVVDIASGVASEIRFARERMRFAEPADIDAAWIGHHFRWQRGPGGGDRLEPRAQFAPWPWRARLWESRPGEWQLTVPRIDGRFVGPVLALLRALPGVQLVAPPPGGDGFDATIDGCMLRGRAFGRDSPLADDQRLSVWPGDSRPGATTDPRCEAALRRLAAAIDAELASGRHDGWIKLGE